MPLTESPVEELGGNYGVALAHRAELQPEQTVFTFLPEGDEEPEEVTFLQLHRRAQSVAAALAASVAARSHTLLLCAPGLDYVAAVFACFQAGVVGVSAPPPQPKRLHRTLPRLLAVAADAEVESVLTTTAIRDAARPLFAEGPLAQAKWIAVDALPEAPGHEAQPGAASDLAFLQYTSGSTRNPRGVMLSHENLIENSEVIADAFGHRPGEETTGLIWLPPYHDMGLIGGILQPVHVGFPCALMSPITVIKRPARWLEAISHLRATTSGGPNFAYDLCVRRVPDEVRDQLDLSSWKVAFNGAEPIRAETLDAFSEKFGPCGFRREAFLPCYGLAEATLIVTGTGWDEEPETLEVDARAAERGALQPSDGSGPATSLVGCGTPYAGHELAIVDAERGRRCAEGEIGEIWTAGPSVALGYWHQPEETAAHFGTRLGGDPKGLRYLRTGDLGALLDGELYVVGRLKEQMILNGRNIHPHDIEFSAEEAHPLLRRHCSAAFERSTDSTAQIAILLEVDAPGETEAEEVISAVRQRVSRDLELPLGWVGLCGAGKIPKTTSGKIQRNLCRAMVDAAEIPILASA